MKCKRIEHPIEYQVEDGTRIRFVKEANIPPYSHRVLILGGDGLLIARDWFSPECHRICSGTALYYWDKHVGKTGKHCS